MQHRGPLSSGGGGPNKGGSLDLRDEAVQEVIRREGISYLLDKRQVSERGRGAEGLTCPCVRMTVCVCASLSPG
jgi:hypothetical protein